MNRLPPAAAPPLPAQRGHAGSLAEPAPRRPPQGLLPWLARSSWLAVVLLTAAGAARADAVDSLRAFIRDVKTGQASFVQTVTSPDGARKKTSSGEFEFSRPNRFRFAYAKPFEQLMVADGQKVWIYDADLNQASSRKLTQALGATPAAVLAGTSLEPEFKLANLPSAQGLDWASATPRAPGASFQEMRVGFRGKELVAIEITDSFGQRSRLDFSRFVANGLLPDARFQFKAPAGADVVEQ